MNQTCMGKIIVNVVVYTMDIEDTILFNKKENKLGGIVGLMISKIIATFGACATYVVTSGWGEKLENGSFTGAIGLLVKGEGDFFFQPLNVLNNNEFLSVSGAVGVDKFLISHLVPNKIHKDKEDDITEFLKFKREINFFLAISLATVFITFISFDYLKNYNELFFKKLSKSFRMIIGLDKFTGGFKKKLIFLALILFYFVFTRIITNGIKTLKVVVDTSSILTDVESVVLSEKLFCVYELLDQTPLFKSAPKGTPLNIIWEDRNVKKKMKYFESNYLLEYALSYDCFYIMNFECANLIARGSFKSTQVQNYWINSKPIYEAYQVFYMSKKMDSKRKFVFENKVTAALESGIISKSYSEVIERADIKYETRSKNIFYTLDKFIEQFTTFSSLQIQSLRTLLFFVLLAYINFLFLFVIFFILLRFFRIS